VLETFDLNGNGLIDYGEFLFVFFDRRELLRKWNKPGREPRLLALARVRACVHVCMSASLAVRSSCRGQGQDLLR
jgi:hypothetical protein